METTVSTIASNLSLNAGDSGKILSMLILGVGSLITGILPAMISEQNRRRYPLVISVLLCFGAGVLLATSLVHMLPDVRKLMPKNAELLLCAGFFIIYFIDEFIHYFFGEAFQHNHENENNLNPSNSGNQSRRHSHQSYGSTANTETSSLLNNESHTQSDLVSQTNELNARICQASHTTTTTTLGLLVALSVHSLIEGLAIGVQDSQSKVLFLLGAVACHKFVMGFCLGLEFRAESNSTLKSQLIAIIVFSFGSVCGIAIGMAIINIPQQIWTQSSLPVLQALAGGTLLYVTICEVLPREKSRWHRRHNIAGLVQFFAVSIGFAVITVINFYLDGD